MAVVAWSPQERQRIFITCPYQEILYGGAAGGGKTDGLLGDFLNHANLYGKNAVGVLFRKSFPEFEEVLRRSNEIYGAIGATYKDKSKSWTFPNGATLRLAYIESYDDALQHRGFQYTWCVARGTRVLMADGTSRAIEHIRVGDMVKTMIGPRMVTMTPPSKKKSCWEVSIGSKSVLVGHDHKMLTQWGWRSPGELSEISSCSVNGHNGDIESCVQYQDAWRPHQLSVPLVLHAQSFLKTYSSQVISVHQHESEHAHKHPVVLDFRSCYPIESRFCGGQPHASLGGDRVHIPSQVDVVPYTEKQLHWGDREKTPLYAGSGGRIGLNHPYTNMHLETSEDALLCQGLLSPADVHEVFDLRIDEASHYLLDNGIISQNCGWDELTLWPTDDEYIFIQSRLRSAAGVPTRIVATTNPGGPGHVWVMKRFFIDVNPGGMKPHHTYLDVKNNQAFEDSNLDKLKDGNLPDGVRRKTRIFIPGRLSDNAFLDTDGEYRARLLSMPEAQRKMLLEGRWDVVEGAFFEEWNPGVHVVKGFKPPKDWKRWMAGDWGSSKPYAFLWGATSPSGDVYIYREMYGSEGKPNVGNRKSAAEVGQLIRGVELEADEWITERYLDASCFDDHGVGTTIAAQFASPAGGGVHFQKSQKKNKAGSISLLRDYLKITNGVSRLKVMDTCVNLIRTLPSLQVDGNNPEQYDTDGEDHATDALIYLIRKNIKTFEDQKADQSRMIRNKKLLQQFGAFGCQ